MSHNIHYINDPTRKRCQVEVDGTRCPKKPTKIVKVTARVGPMAGSQLFEVVICDYHEKMVTGDTKAGGFSVSFKPMESKP